VRNFLGGGKRHYEAIDSHQMDHLRVFHDVARTLTSTLELDEVLHTIMSKMADFFGPERWSLMMVDEHNNDLYYAIAVGENEQTLKGLRVPLGEGMAGWVAATGNALVVPDVALDPHWANFSRHHPELNIQSIACLPVRANNRTLGVIQLLNSKLDLMSEFSISFLRILCDYAAIAIQNARSMNLIQELSITDDCTGLFNARHLYAMMEEQVQFARRAEELKTPSQFSLLFVDLDRFKGVNDTHGHLIGSLLLAEVGGVIKRSIGPENAAFRYGGDEFVALLPGMGKDAAMATTMELCQRLRDARFLEGKGLALNVSGSFGLATFPEDGNSVHAILRSADKMMYEVKNSTRNNVAVAGRGMVMTPLLPTIRAINRPKLG
jgi:diguanylate cyclase (GGDEF)-like protein